MTTCSRCLVSTLRSGLDRADVDAGSPDGHLMQAGEEIAMTTPNHPWVFEAESTQTWL